MSQDNTILQRLIDLEYDYKSFKRFVEGEIESLTLGLTREKKRNANALRRFKELKQQIEEGTEIDIAPQTPQTAFQRPPAGTPLFQKFPSYKAPDQATLRDKPLNPLSNQVNEEINNLNSEIEQEEEE